MVTGLVIFAAGFSACMIILGTAAVVPVVFGLADQGLLFMLAFCLTAFATAGLLAGIAALWAAHTIARAIITLGAICAVMIVSAAMLMIATLTLGISTAYAWPVSVGFGVLLMVWNPETRLLLMGRLKADLCAPEWLERLERQDDQPLQNHRD